MPRFLRGIGWLLIGAVCGAVYGVVNDQITITLAPEYFTIFKHRQFSQPLRAFGLINAPPRLQAVLVGTLATWWFGLTLGLLLSFGGLSGRKSPLSTTDYLRAVGGVMALTLCLSIVFGVIAYLAEPMIGPTPDDWPFLAGITHVRDAFAVGWWHNGAYLGGALGTIAAIAQVRRRRNLDSGLPRP